VSADNYVSLIPFDDSKASFSTALAS
jgi:hypothetical protein